MVEWKYKPLAQRFVSDYKLPIPIITEDIFKFHLNKYEEKYKSLTKWNDLLSLIDERFDGNFNRFLDDYYQIRDNIITTVLDSDAFKKFNTMTIDGYSFKNEESVTSNNIYNQTNVGKKFVSIDLKKANFQILRKMDKDIVLGANTYEEFIGKFTDIDYIKNSKYTRQIIFGKMNPKRHIKLEKYYTYLMYKLLDTYAKSHGWKIVSLNSDEIVYEASNAYCETDYIIESIKEKLGLIVHVELFVLNGYTFSVKGSEHHKVDFYVKKNLINGEEKMVSVPLPYHSLIYSLYNDEVPNELDYHFNYEGYDCIFNEDFEIKEIKNG